MISFTVRMKFRSDDRQRVAELLTALARASRQEPGCVAYVPHTVEGEPDTVVIYEQYADEKALEAHRASAHFGDSAVGGLYQLMLDRQVENLTTIA
ncbi:MAG TPA: putative quinol monooxygenase [Acidobacteriaceae bacterium]|jgi:quinol monooxygenase YgiN|nr:putative quinol monooxygenase [Acidobacteriaceae bacterium]